MQKIINYISRLNNQISINLYESDTAHKHNNIWVIAIHGFKGFKDWGFWPYTCNELALKGCTVVSFNFSHNGIGNDSELFTELDKFKNNSFSLELDELNEIINSTYEGKFGEFNQTEKIILLGHSRGGGEAVIAAAENQRVSGVIAWAPISHFNRYTDRQKEEWKKNGVLPIPNSRTGQVMYIGLELLNDIEENAEGRLNLKKRIQKLNVPLCLIHGQNDLTVPVSESADLYEWNSDSDSLNEFHVIQNTGHTFNAVHPFPGSNDKLEQVLNVTYGFIEKLNRI